MLRPQMLEAIFVAGSVLVGMTGSAVTANNWSYASALAQAEAHFAYALVSAQAQHGPECPGRVLQRLRASLRSE